MTHPELFELPETLSPLEAWRRRHDVRTVKDGDCWLAWAGTSLEMAATIGTAMGAGKTEESAMIDLARCRGIPGWLEEAYLPMCAGRTA